MNKLILKILVFNLLLAFSSALEAGDLFNLHLNKHYFLVDENIYFSFHVSSPSIIPERLPLYATLMKINEDHQLLVKAVKLSWDGQHTSGYVPVTEDLESGNYLLGLFSEHGLNHNIPFHFAYIYIFNPLDTEVDTAPIELNYDVKTGSLTSTTETPSNIIKNENYKVSYEIQHNQRDNQTVFYGKITPNINQKAPYHLSASVIDKRFYDVSQNDLVMQVDKTILPDYLRTWEQDLAKNGDSILNASKYIHGRLWINNQPASIKKVYFFAQKDSVTILDFYITSQNGIFIFKEPEFGDTYSIKFFTVPEADNTYSFQLLNRLYSDSIYHLNIPNFTLAHTEVFQNYAIKKYLIDQSYVPVREIASGDASADYPLIVGSSHEIILDDYIYFPTLPEIIREIVPLVSIQYKKGTYQIRVYDSRVKQFCCKGNPLIFVNNNPYPDNAGIMRINTNDIYSIEVIRPVEAINQFDDIGVNGILKINLHPEINRPSIVSNSIADLQIAGYQTEQKTIQPEFSDDYPDFRSLLFWNGDIQSGINGEFQFQFQLSRLTTDLMIVISGLLADGQFIYKEIDYNP